MSETNSKIFAPYRALGINSDHVPCVVRYNHKHQETYAITSVGKSFHVYKVVLNIFFIKKINISNNLYYKILLFSVRIWV